VLSGFVLARASAGLTDETIRGDISHLEQVRTWFGRPLWELEPADADAYFGREMRGASSGTRLARSQALRTYFAFLELRHQVELHAMTWRVVQCPIDEANRPRGNKDAKFADPADGGGDREAVHGLGGGVGHVPQARSNGAELHGGAVDD
jgi:integrase/recombinase XerD